MIFEEKIGFVICGLIIHLTPSNKSIDREPRTSTFICMNKLL